MGRSRSLRQHQGQGRLQVVCKNIVCWFRVPHAIVANNGPQFDSIVFQTFCSELNIKNLYSTPRYPQSNRQVEVTNKILSATLKKKLEEAKGKWVNGLLRVLWAYRTTFRRPTGATHFTIAYGMETVIPIEIDMPIAKMVMQGQKDNDKELEKHLDWANEIRKNAGIRMASYRQRAIAHYNKKV